MSRSFLTQHERSQFDSISEDISQEDLAAYFTLTIQDKELIHQQRRDHNKLGFALQLCILRYLGFIINNITSLNSQIISHVAKQLQIRPQQLGNYGKRDQTRTDHTQSIMQYLHFRKADIAYFHSLIAWLTERALEHDKPLLLLKLCCEKLRLDKVIRPGIAILEGITNMELEDLLVAVDQQFPINPNAKIENDKLVLSPLFAENLPDSVSDLQNLITNELPRLDITDLLVEVDHWTHFSDCFIHAGGNQPRTKDFLVHLYASILAQTCNFGLKKMAEITGLTYDKLAWCTCIGCHFR